MFFNSREHKSVANIIFVESRKTFLTTFRTIKLDTTPENIIPDWNLLNPRLDTMFRDQI